MNIRTILLVSFIVEIIAETGFGFSKVIFTGFSLKNLLLLILLAVVFTTGGKNSVSERQARLRFSKAIHRNYILYMGTVIVATVLANIFIENPEYQIVPVILSIKSSILDPYLVFLIFLLYPKNKQEFEKTLNSILSLIVLLAGMTLLASVVSPGMFFGVDNDAARPNGPFGEPNQTAAVLSMVLITVMAPLVRSRRFSYPRLVASIILLGCILVTGSRGGLLAAVLATAYFLLTMRNYLSAGKKITILVASLFGLVITWLILPAHVHELIMTRLGIFESSHIDWREASAGRTYLWTMAMEKCLESPIFGIGWMGFTTIFGNPTHNSYLEVLVSSGPLGLLFYGLLFKNILTVLNKTNELQAISEIVLLKGFKGSAIALFAAVFFVNLYIPWLVVWALFGLMVGYSYALQEEHSESNAPIIRKSRKRNTLTQKQNLKPSDYRNQIFKIRKA